MDRSLRHKINQETLVLNDTLDQMELRDLPFKSSRIYFLLKHIKNILPGKSYVRLQNKSTDLGRPKSYQASISNTEINKNKTKKFRNNNI